MNNTHKAVDRFEAYESIEFDQLIRDIQTKKIRVGRLADLVKVKSSKINKEDIFNGRANNSDN